MVYLTSVEDAGGGQRKDIVAIHCVCHRVLVKKTTTTTGVRLRIDHAEAVIMCSNIDVNISEKKHDYNNL